MSKIDFDKIIEEQWDLYSKDPTRKYTKECIKQACIQVLDEVAERAEAEMKEVITGGGLTAEYIPVVNKQSILKIKEEL